MHSFGHSKLSFECFEYNPAIRVTEMGICVLCFTGMHLFSHKLYYCELSNVQSENCICGLIVELALV